MCVIYMIYVRLYFLVQIDCDSQDDKASEGSLCWVPSTSTRVSLNLFSPFVNTAYIIRDGITGGCSRLHQDSKLIFDCQNTRIFKLDLMFEAREE